MDNLLHNFLFVHSKYTKDMIDHCWESDAYELTVALKNGETLVYDDFDHTILFLPTDRFNMTEAQTRREFGRRLKRRIAHSPLTQQDLADKTGISQSTISNYMRGSMSPSIHNVKRIAHVLNCDIDDLVY